MTNTTTSLTQSNLTSLLLQQVQIIIRRPTTNRRRTQNTGTTLRTIALSRTLLSKIRFTTRLRTFSHTSTTAVNRSNRRHTALSKLIISPRRTNTTIKNITTPINTTRTRLLSSRIRRRRPQLSITNMLNTIRNRHCLRIALPN